MHNMSENKTKTLSFRVAPSYYESLKRTAEALGMSQSEVLAESLDEYLALAGCTATQMMPDDATLIERIDDRWIVFELRGQLFLYGHNDVGELSAITKLDKWP